MIKKFLFFLTAILPCFAQSVGDDTSSFGLSLYEQAATKRENIVLSPYGIFSNLALLSFGAEGATQSQIEKALHLTETGEIFLTAFSKLNRGLSSTKEGGYTLSISNALFPNTAGTLLEPFQKTATTYFDANIQQVDYGQPTAAAKEINSWINEATHGKIKDLISSDDLETSTQLVATNAVYFQGKWQFPFSAKKTTSMPFYLDESTSIPTTMLTQTKTLSYFENAAFQGLTLPFRRKDASQPALECLVLLPKTQGPIPTLTPQALSAMRTQKKATLVEAHIPKFCFSTRLNLSTALKALGMKDAFSYLADFSNINGMQNLILNKVLHEAFFSFYEDGVTAAAATASIVGVTSAAPSEEKPITFTADHPFLFFIIDTHSDAILFMGQCANPTRSNCDGKS